MEPTRAPGRSERVLVIGGGLVGCVLAICLARRGIGVTIYERSRDCRGESRTGRPSLSLSLCTRGIRSLQRAGVMGRVWPLLAPAFGRMIHAADGSVSYQQYSEFGEAIHCVSRSELSMALLDAVEEQGIEILFERRCVHLDAATGEITIEDPAGARSHDRARAVFAADGAFSTVRHRLQAAGHWRYSQTISEEGYKEFRIPAATAAELGLRGDALHGWPRPHLIAGAFPRQDGSFSGTLHLSLSGPTSFDTLSDGSAVASLAEAECPELARAVPDLAEHLAAQRPNSLVTVMCRPWSAAGRVLLVGDAAHAMLPYYGQGANAGFQDCEILDDLIARHGPDWSRVFLEFEAIRRPDVEAMSDLCREHLTVLRDLAGRPAFQAQWSLEQRLHRLLPDAFTPLYSMIAFSSMSYADARRRDRLQQQVVRGLLRDPDVRRRLAEPVWDEPFRRHIRWCLSAAVTGEMGGARHEAGGAP